ncbi:MAG: ParB/RepB/Spo0J family partition protein [Acidobacteriota bacterium]|jgi:ParB family transcriptional regulator, chromosome partitioning protein
MKRKALGKGLDALLPQTNESGALVMIDIDLIHPNPLQPRLRFEIEKLDELAASIREKGILQPIVVRPTEIGYEIIAGERRWRACQRAAVHQIPAIVQDVSDQDMLELALIENIQRDDLSPIEEAQAYQLMVEQFGLTQEQVADKVARSRTAVTNTLRLLQLPKTIQEMVINRDLSMGHARALIPLEPRDQLQLARAIVARGLSVRDTERRAQRLTRASKPSRPKSSKDPNIRSAEERLEERWRTRVEIRQRGQKGQIVLHFDSSEELDRLFEDLIGEN